MKPMFSFKSDGKGKTEIDLVAGDYSNVNKSNLASEEVENSAEGRSLVMTGASFQGVNSSKNLIS